MCIASVRHRALAAAGLTLSELHIDRAYLASDMVRQRDGDLAIYCKAWRVRNTTGHYAKTDFTLDFTTSQLTCPAGVTMRFEPGKTVHFPRHACAICPLREHCTASPSGRSVAIHPDEALLTKLRQRQQTPRCSTASWWRRIKISAVFHISSRRDSHNPAVTRVIRRNTNRRHMIGDHHGR